MTDSSSLYPYLPRDVSFYFQEAHKKGYIHEPFSQSYPYLNGIEIIGNLYFTQRINELTCETQLLLALLNGIWHTVKTEEDFTWVALSNVQIAEESRFFTEQDVGKYLQILEEKDLIGIQYSGGFRKICVYPPVPGESYLPIVIDKPQSKDALNICDIIVLSSLLNKGYELFEPSVIIKPDTIPLIYSECTVINNLSKNEILSSLDKLHKLGFFVYHFFNNSRRPHLFLNEMLLQAYSYLREKSMIDPAEKKHNLVIQRWGF